MGWSYGVTARSQALRDKMLEFLGEHYRTGSDVLGNLAPMVSRGYPLEPVEGAGLSYDDGGPLKLGFNNGGLFEATMLQWVAVKIGRTRILSKLPKPTPYLTYDGKSYPLLIKSQWPVIPPRRYGQWVIVDDIGYCPMQRPWSDWSVEGLKEMTEWIAGRALRFQKIDGIVRSEMERLDALWETE